MANTSDTLELKVTDSEYASRIGQLDQKISKLTGILQDYQTLKNDATQVFGDDDQNLASIQQQVQGNINAVQGQINMLNQAREMLQKQSEELGLLGQNVGTMFKEAAETAASGFKAIQAVSEVAGLVT